MQRPIRPGWLLRLASELTERGRGQPRNADLRRATSTAYYALFHRIAIDTARHLLPDGSEEEVWRAARYVAHASVRDVCRWVAGNTPPEHLQLTVTRLRAERGVASIAPAFIKLNEQREAADYDHFGDFTRPGTRKLVNQAQRSVDLLWTRRDDEPMRSFFGLISLRTSLRNH